MLVFDVEMYGQIMPLTIRKENLIIEMSASGAGDQIEVINHLIDALIKRAETDDILKIKLRELRTKLGQI